MAFDAIQAVINIAVSSLIFLIVVLIIWLATKRHKIEDPKIEFLKPKRDAAISISVVLAIAAILAVYIYLLYQNAGGTIGTPTQFSLNGALLQWGIYAALFMLPVFAVIKLRKQGLQTVGITKKNAWFSLGLSLALAAGLSVIITPIISHAGNILTASSFFGLIYFSAVGFGEELLFRGFLQTRCIGWLGAGKGLVLASLIMAFIHLPQRIFAVGLDPIEAIASAAILVPYSLTLGFLMLRTKNLVGPAVLHTTIDWLSNI